MSLPPPLLPDELMLRHDRSVWSKRHRRLVHGAGHRGRLLDQRLREPGIKRLLLLGFGAGIELLQACSLTDSITICERFPPTRDSLRKVWTALALANARHPGLEAAGQESTGSCLNRIIEQWPIPSHGFHRIQLKSSAREHRPLELTLAWGEPERLLGEMTGPFDLIWINGSAGGLNLLAGSRPGLSQLRGLSHAQTCVAGLPDAVPVMQVLGSHGLNSSNHASGWCGRWRGFRSRTPNHFQKTAGGNKVLVLGAGIAGLSVARELAGAGLPVTVVEQHPQGLLGGSAQPVLAGHLHFSSDDNLLARLTRAAQALQPRLNLATAIGRLQLLPDALATEAARQMHERLALPAELVRVVEAEEASELAGLRLQQAARWQSATRLLMPDQLCTGLPGNIDLITGKAVHHMHQAGGEWTLLDKQHRVIAGAPVIILCTGSMPLGERNAAGTEHRLLLAKSLDTRAVAGQTTRLSDEQSSRLRCIVGEDSYACPLPDGSVLTGASYRPATPGASFSAQTEPDTRTADQHANIAGWHHLTRANLKLSTQANGRLQILGNFVGQRYTTIDHLPLIGAVPDEHQARQQWHALHRDDRLPIPVMPGVFMAAGFGSRGSLWSALAAALLPDCITSSQPPIERSLIAAIAPQRFLRKAIRRYSSPEACNMSTQADSPNEGHASHTAHD